MADLPGVCPSCRAPLAAVRLKCQSCDVQLEGAFELPALMRLTPADLEFVVRFVRTSGSLKAMAKDYGQSYPTIRNRLNDIIEQLDDRAAHAAQQRHSILDAIAQGKLTVAQAELKLRELAR